MVHQRKINQKQRQLVKMALQALPRGANPAEGEDPETSARRPGCEHANACISVACAGNWEALSCASCDLFGVPEDRRGALLELAGRGGVTWSEYTQGLKNADVGPIRQALKNIPQAHGRSWIDEKETSMATQSVFEKLEGDAAAMVQSMIAGSSTNYSGVYKEIRKAAGKQPTGTLAAFRMYVIGRRRKAAGSQKKKVAKKKVAKKTKPLRATTRQFKITPAVGRVSVSHPEKLAQIAVSIVTEVAELDIEDRARVFEAVDRLLT